MSAPVVVNQPGVYFVDADGNTATLDDAETIGSAEGFIIMGRDGTVARMMVVDATGKLAIQDPPNMDVALSTLATETKLEAVRALLATIDADTSTLAAVDYATQATLATLATEAKLEAVRVLLASLDGKDYATQTTLAAILVDTGQIETLLTSLDGKDYATQTTLAAILVDTGQIEALLTSIDVDTSVLALVDYATQTTLASVLATQTDKTQFARITDGTNDAVVDASGDLQIRHVDPLPPGTNILGRSGLRSNNKGTSVAADLTSENIDANTEALDTNLAGWLGSVDPTVGQKVMDASIPVTIASNQPAIPVSVGAAASEGAVTEYVTINGLPSGSHDMVVNGTIPKSFTFPAHATRDIVLTGVRLVFSAAFFNFDGNTFGKGGGVLSNGVEMKIIANGGIFTATLATLVVNEDFFRLLQFSISQAGATDVMAATLPFQGRVVLEAGTSDKVEVVINDNLTIGARGITYFTGTVYGVLEPL